MNRPAETDIMIVGAGPPALLARGRGAFIAAFSLIEVLIAVMVLALGLLGLGAIFPVVMREQRIGNELTVGVAAGNSARAMLEAVDTRQASNQQDFWVRWRDQELVPHNDSINGFRLGQWKPAPIFNTQTGAVLLGDDRGANQRWVLPLAARLYPVAEGRGGQPQFVWDLAIQRVWDGNNDPNDDLLRIAVFVRRIDPRIRVPSGLTLYRLLTDPTVPAAERRVPVAEDSNGVATLDGHGGGGTPNYSGIKTFQVRFDYDPNAPRLAHRDRLYYDRPGPPQNSVEWRQIIQPNQRLIDNLGNIYTVIGSGVESGEAYVRINPPVPGHIDENSADQIIQVAFTPQVPAAVMTWIVDPRRLP